MPKYTACLLPLLYVRMYADVAALIELTLHAKTVEEQLKCIKEVAKPKRSSSWYCAQPVSLSTRSSSILC